MSSASPHSARDRHLHWGAPALWAQLEPLLPGLSVEVLARTASTNTELLERARIVRPTRPGALDAGPSGAVRIGRRQADTQPCLLVAEHQMAGRGRLGRGWQSARGASLTFSLALPLSPPDWSGLSLVVGIALAEVLAASAPSQGPGPSQRLGLKWPNDLWLVPAAGHAAEGGAAGGRKLGGVLIETLAAVSQRLAVIGIGLNIAPLPAGAMPEAPEQRACLRELDAQATAPETLARVALPLVQALQLFDRQGFPAFADRFAALDLLRDRAIVSTDARAPAGIARGVDRQGALRVESATGLHTLYSGEVSVRPAAAAVGLPPPPP